jgi:hypothetical protein
MDASVRLVKALGDGWDGGLSLEQDQARERSNPAEATSRQGASAG